MLCGDGQVCEWSTHLSHMCLWQLSGTFGFCFPLFLLAFVKQKKKALLAAPMVDMVFCLTSSAARDEMVVRELYSHQQTSSYYHFCFLVYGRLLDRKNSEV
jgi:hypothetical protein